MMTDPNNPFDILPSNLFNLFSTQGHTTLQRHYIAILLRIYALAEFNRFGLTREIVIAEIVDYLKTEGAMSDVSAEITAELEADVKSQTISAQKPEHEYAAILLRRLDETGWVEREQHADYTETVIIPDYAFTLLEAFRTIREQKPREFSGLLYTAHQLVMASITNKDFAPALAITQAYENVRQVVRGLNELNQNIRRYIERATHGRDVAELLHLQFDDYARTLGPTYHALKTSDHVSRYRSDIISQLQAWQLDSKWLDRATRDLTAQSSFTPAQASHEISQYLQFIIHQLEELDPLLADIDQRHAQYLRTSLRQVRHQLASADGGFKDRLVSLGRQLAALKDEGRSELPEEAPPLLKYPVHQPDLRSFYTPPRRRAPFQPAEVITKILHPSDLVALRAATLQDVTQALTPDRVNRIVIELFNGHQTLHVTELPPEVTGDLQRLTTIIAFAYHPEVEYGVEVIPGEPLEIGPYRLVPFRLEKL